MLLPADAVPRETRRRTTRSKIEGERKKTERGNSIQRDGREGGREQVRSEKDERGPVWRKVGGSGTGKKLGTKHDISLTESGHFLPRLFRRVLRLERRKRNFVFLVR